LARPSTSNARWIRSEAPNEPFRDFDALLDRAASTRRTSGIALEASRRLLLGAWVLALVLDRIVCSPARCA
jgi:hypothetical protein